MSIQIILTSPEGIEYPVHDQTMGQHALIVESLPEITLQLEEDSNEITSDDVTISLRNDDGFWTAQLAVLDVAARFLWTGAPGVWTLKIWKSGSLRWTGDLDPMSVEWDEKQSTVSLTFLGAIKRLERYNAAKVIRVNNDLVSAAQWASVRKDHPRVLECLNYFPSSADSADPTRLNLEPSDIMIFTKLKADGKITTQELEVIQTPHANPGNRPALPSPNADHKIRVRQRLKVDYNSSQGNVGSWCDTPWWRNRTVAFLAQKLLLHCNIPAGSYSIYYTPILDGGAEKTVPVGDFQGKNVSEALTELGLLVDAFLFWRPGGIYFQGRDLDVLGATSTDLTGKICEQQTTSIWEKLVRSIVVQGSEKRRRRFGSLTYPLSQAEISTDYMDDLTWLGKIGERLYSWWGAQRKYITVEVADDGHQLYIWDVVTLPVLGTPASYRITKITEPLRAADTEHQDKVSLDLVQRDATAPPAGETADEDEADDTEEPEPPTDFEITKLDTTWPLINTLFPKAQYPRFEKRTVCTDPEADPPTYKTIKRRLWFFRFKYPYDTRHLLGFHLVKWNEKHDGGPDNRDRDKPIGEANWYEGVEPQADGYYYFPPKEDGATYMRCGAKRGCAVEAVFDNGKISAQSDPAYTDEENEDDPDAPPAAIFDSFTTVAADTAGRFDAVVDIHWDAARLGPKKHAWAVVCKMEDDGVTVKRRFERTIDLDDADPSAQITFQDICAAGKKLWLKRLETMNQGQITRTEVNGSPIFPKTAPYLITAGGGPGSLPTAEFVSISWDGTGAPGYIVNIQFDDTSVDGVWCFAAAYGTLPGAYPPETYPTSWGYDASPSYFSVLNIGGLVGSKRQAWFKLTQRWLGSALGAFSTASGCAITLKLYLGTTKSADWMQCSQAPATVSTPRPYDYPHSYTETALDIIYETWKWQWPHACDRLIVHYRGGVYTAPPREAGGSTPSGWTNQETVVITSGQENSFLDLAGGGAITSLIAALRDTASGEYGEFTAIVHNPTGLWAAIYMTGMTFPSRLRLLWHTGYGGTKKWCVWTRTDDPEGNDPPGGYGVNGNGWTVCWSGSGSDGIDGDYYYKDNASISTQGYYTYALYNSVTEERLSVFTRCYYTPGGA